MQCKLVCKRRVEPMHCTWTPKPPHHAASGRTCTANCLVSEVTREVRSRRFPMSASVRSSLSFSSPACKGDRAGHAQRCGSLAIGSHAAQPESRQQHGRQRLTMKAAQVLELGRHCMMQQWLNNKHNGGSQLGHHIARASVPRCLGEASQQCHTQRTTGHPPASSRPPAPLAPLPEPPHTPRRSSEAPPGRLPAPPLPARPPPAARPPWRRPLPPLPPTCGARWTQTARCRRAGWCTLGH